MLANQFTKVQKQRILSIVAKRLAVALWKCESFDRPFAGLSGSFNYIRISTEKCGEIAHITIYKCDLVFAYYEEESIDLSETHIQLSHPDAFEIIIEISIRCLTNKGYLVS